MLNEKYKDKEELLIPFPIEEGKTWTVRFYNPIEDSLVTYSCKIEGIETLENLDDKGKITKFKDCLKISLDDKSYMDMDRVRYYAPKIGLVKEISPGVGGVMQLEKYTR